MKLTIPRTDLTRALSIVRAAAGGGSLPILGNVALSANATSLELTCTDLDLYLQTATAARVAEKGGCTVNAALLFNIVNSLKEDEVALTQAKDLLTVQAGPSKYNLGILEMKEFPPVPTLKQPVTFELPQVKLRSVLADTAFCSSDDGARYVLNSSFLTVNSKLSAVATDGRRLCLDEAEIDKRDQQKEKTEMILPVKAVEELLRLLPDTEPDDEPLGSVKVAISKSNVMFRFGEVTLWTRLIEGKYPNYKQVIPQDDPNPIPISRVDLLAALKRIALIGADRCVLEFEGQMLTVQARGEKGCPSEAWETLLIPKVAPLKVAFAPRYLIEALEAISDDEVLLHLTDGLSPIVFKVAGRAWLCVVMPMRIGEPATAEAKEEASKTEPNKAEPTKGEAEKLEGKGGKALSPAVSAKK